MALVFTNCILFIKTSLLFLKLLVALAIATVLAEPEADANPDAWYGGYYGYHGYPYSSYGYYGYPYRRYYGHYLGKREAEAVAPAVDDKVALHPGIYGLGYATIAANPVVGNPGYALAKSYVPYHHGHFLGKRSALPQYYNRTY